jgi:hypothetical protein
MISDLLICDSYRQSALVVLVGSAAKCEVLRTPNHSSAIHSKFAGDSGDAHCRIRPQFD